ncbi:MAG: restriction endonuclease [Bacilli bacterium]
MNAMQVDESFIKEFLSHRDYDLRKSGYGRWIDQKCTPDVITIISDCILSFVLKNASTSFTSRDIWHSDYANKNVLAIFGKPLVEDYSAKNEYDKFFQQPMKLLSYAGILCERKSGNENIYTISNQLLLEYLSIREKNSIIFLNLYIEKVLKDSDHFLSFELFFSDPNRETYSSLKDSFERFTKAYTKITGKTESDRIFTKVLNPLSFSRQTNGTERGRISSNPITLDMLMYNRENFRDINNGKPKGKTRKNYIGTTPQLYSKIDAYLNYLSEKAKKYVGEYNKENNNGLSEIDVPNEVRDFAPATQKHHIFMKNEFPNLAGLPENIICLTPNQHQAYAHPNNHTSEISKRYQYICLLSKSDTIENSYVHHLGLYEFDNFLKVLAEGLSDNTYLDVPKNNYSYLKLKINASYQTI